MDAWRVAAAAQLKGDAARNHAALEQSGVPDSTPPRPRLPLRPGDVVIDALFGTGLARAPSGEAADAIRQMLRWRLEGVRVLAGSISPRGSPATPVAPSSPASRPI